MQSINRLAAQQHDVDHNIMRHLRRTLSPGHFEGDIEYDDGLEFDEQAQRMSPINAPVVETIRREVPSAEVKSELRVALFGFLEAARQDEMELVRTVLLYCYKL